MATSLRFLILLASLVFLNACGLLRQVNVSPIDRQAESLISQGKQLLKNKDYIGAMDAFEMARDRDFHRGSTAATYLSGLAAYYANYQEVAEERFQMIKERYPLSRYIDEASYHLALLNLRGRGSADQAKGLESLYTMGESASSPRLREDAKSNIRYFLFDQAPIDELAGLEGKLNQNLASMLLDARVYRLVGNDQEAEARALYDAHLAAGGQASSMAQKLLPEEKVQLVGNNLFEPGIAKIAVFLPTHLDQYGLAFLDEIPEKSRLALHFYEGLEMALETKAPEMDTKVFFKFFDTQRDSFRTRAQLATLDSLRPNLIVGEIFNTQSRIISEWSESQGVPQIVPISVTPDLIEEKTFTFLAHPRAETHGIRLAQYAFENLGVTHVSVFSDRGRNTQLLADGFTERFLELGGTVDSLFISKNYELAIEEIPELVDDIPQDTAERMGVYIPLMGNEESASLIVNVLKQKARDVVVMGSPHFRSRYNTLNRDTKESYELLFTTSHMVDTHDPEFEAFYQAYLKKFALPPSDEAIQGYDLGLYILDLLNSYVPNKGIGLESFMRVAPAFKGLHLDYRFESQQSNQRVNIGQYLPDGVVRVSN